MNFTKHRINERQMLSELLDYCSKIITHKRKNDERFSTISCCISTRTHGVEITQRKGREEELMMAIRYDERNDFYYFLETMHIGKRTLENRIIIHRKEDFYAYFEHVISKSDLE